MNNYKNRIMRSENNFHVEFFTNVIYLQLLLIGCLIAEVTIMFIEAHQITSFRLSHRC